MGFELRLLGSQALHRGSHVLWMWENELTTVSCGWHGWLHESTVKMRLRWKAIDTSAAVTRREGAQTYTPGRVSERSQAKLELFKQEPGHSQPCGSAAGDRADSVTVISLSRFSEQLQNVTVLCAVEGKQIWRICDFWNDAIIPQWIGTHAENPLIAMTIRAKYIICMWDKEWYVSSS